MKRQLLLALLCMAAMCCRAEDLTLWYSRPAAEWTEALPVGNSRMGAMVYGGTGKETIQFNEETFWSGSPYNNDSPRALAALPEVRRLIFAGREKEAGQLLDQTFFTGQHGMRFLPAGYLHMDFPGHENATAYRRQLDLATALATTTYTVDGTRYKRTVTAPMGTGVVMIRVEADKPGALAFTAMAAAFDGIQALPEETRVFLHLDGLTGWAGALLPLSGAGFGWVCPAVLGTAIGLLVRRCAKRKGKEE